MYWYYYLVNMSKKQISLLNFFSKPSSSPALLSFRNSGDGQNDSQPASPISSTQQTIGPSRKQKQESDKKYNSEQRMRGFLSSWQTAYPWVEFDGEFMFCTVCREFQHLLSSKNVLFLSGLCSSTMSVFRDILPKRCLQESSPPWSSKVQTHLASHWNHDVNVYEHFHCRKGFQYYEYC